MQSSARDSYLTTEVMTATPQRLQLLLLDGAVRYCEQARQHWEDSDFGPATESLIRAQDIISEILSNLNKEVDAELVKKVAAIYAFIFRCLMEACILRDVKKLDDAVRILHIERETWRALGEQVGSPPAASARVDSTSFQDQPALPAAPPVMETDPLTMDEYTGGFSLDA